MVKKQKVKPKAKEKRRAKEKVVKVLGIDDSGRGPVIGPMVMVGVMIPYSLQEKFKEIGIKDSKKVLPNKRRQLAEYIKSVSEFSIIRVWPYEIDFGDHVGINLNKLEAIKSAQIINDMMPDMAIIDCPSPNIPKWQTEVEKRINLKKKVNLLVEHKADVNHPVVSAASILAKVARDEEIEKIQDKIPFDIGSGYTSDPITRKFLEKNWDKYKGIFREKWQTWKLLKKNKEQKKLFDFE